MSMNIDDPDQLITKIVKVFEKKALRDEQDNFNMSLINLRNFRGCFFEVKKQLQKEQKEVLDPLKIRNLKKNIKLIDTEFMKQQNRSKIINIEPLFNKPEYLGINTEPLPDERYLIELNYPQVQVTYKDGLYSKQLHE